MKLKPVIAVVLLSVAFGAQARTTTAKTAKPAVVASYKAETPAKNTRFAQAGQNVRQAFSKVRARFVHTPVEREYSTNVPRPIISAEINSPW